MKELKELAKLIIQRHDSGEADYDVNVYRLARGILDYDPLQGVDKEKAIKALVEARGSIDNHSYRHYSVKELDDVLSTLSNIENLFED
jgi:hypothetical protein